MNKTAFKLLIDHLKEEFSKDKIEKYIHTLNDIKESSLTAPWEINLISGMHLPVQDKNDKSQSKAAIKTRNEELDYLISGLDFIGNITKELQNKNLDESIDILRKNFIPLSKEAYDVGFCKPENLNDACSDHKVLYFLLNSGGIANPEYDDQNIFAFFSNMSSCFRFSASDRLKEKDKLPKDYDVLRQKIFQSKALMYAADQGLLMPYSDPELAEYEKYEGKEDQLNKDINDKDIRPLEKISLESIKKAMHTPSPDYIPETRSGDTTLSDDKITADFFLNMNNFKKSKSKEMSNLLNVLDSYHTAVNGQSGAFPISIKNVDFFSKIQEMTADIRKKSANISPKDFHDTEMFLQSVDAYSEKMIHILETEKKEPAEKTDLTIARARDVADRLFSRLDQAADGKQSKEFSDMYNALDKLSSRTACDTRQLMEQIIEVKNAADKYIKSKNSFRIEGHRSTNKGQARYDAACSISNMMNVLINPIQQLNKENNLKLFGKGKRMASSESEIEESNTPGFCYSKAFYMQNARNTLKHLDKSNDDYSIEFEKGNSDLKIKGNYVKALRHYINFLELADNRDERLKLNYKDFLEKFSTGKLATTLLTDRGKEVFKYVNIAGSSQFKNTVLKEEDFNETASIGFPIDGEMVANIYKGITKHYEFLKNYEKLNKKQTDKLLKNQNKLEEEIRKYVEKEFIFTNSQTRGLFTKHLVNDHINALNNHMQLLQSANPNPKLGRDSDLIDIRDSISSKGFI